MIRLAFFDSKEYDIRSFNSHIDSSKYLIKYFGVRLNEDTAKLANGYDAVIAFNLSKTTDSTCVVTI